MSPVSRRRALFCLAALGLPGSLAACGKKGRPRPPEGEESSYTYPRFYPSRKSVEATPDRSQTRTDDRPNDVETSPFPWSREKTRTYGTE